MSFLSIVLQIFRTNSQDATRTGYLPADHGFVAEARFHGINPYQRLLSKCVIYLLNKHVQQLLRGERRGGGGGGRPSTG